jgi:hypothetical protein
VIHEPGKQGLVGDYSHIPAEAVSKKADARDQGLAVSRRLRCQVNNAKYVFYRLDGVIHHNMFLRPADDGCHAILLGAVASTPANNGWSTEKPC